MQKMDTFKWYAKMTSICPNLVDILEYIQMQDKNMVEFQAMINANNDQSNREMLYLAKLDLKHYPGMEYLHQIIRILETKLRLNP